MKPTTAAEAELLVLSTVLNRLIPPDEELPGAGDLGLAAPVLADAEGYSGKGRSLHIILDGLPDDFRQLDGYAQDAALRLREIASPQDFSDLIALAYGAYYTDERVLRHLARTTGYPARPPQPLGYLLEPFDEKMLERVRQRLPLWRRC